MVAPQVGQWLSNLKYFMKNTLCVLAAALLLTGCESTLKSPATAGWNSSRVLGPIKATSGIWPLSLNAPPPQYTYFAALRDQAAYKFNVPPASVEFDEMTVRVGSEMDGTVRDWTATAIAGQNTNSITH